MLAAPPLVPLAAPSSSMPSFHEVHVSAAVGCPGPHLLDEHLLETALHEGLGPLGIPLVSCAAPESGTWGCLAKAGAGGL